ncbi:MAG TPA: 16S rRNA (guanine(966)-N(2))-methyltransferase RsmD [Clostridia bacterium]|nr:16S rRNA (guanine(966)-N(2))-methyltransferase RsmD [Clostridia bacterium]
MRVIAGKAKGLPLVAPRGWRTRPTSDRVKEAIFSTLQERMPGAFVLDLFAGSGALGIESLSRGAARAVFVEKDPRSLACVRANLQKTGMILQSEVFFMDALCYLRQLRETFFDLIFLDPPYTSDLGQKALDLILAKNLLQTDGCIVWEASANCVAQDPPSGLQLWKKKIYGDTRVLYFQHASKGEAYGYF